MTFLDPLALALVLCAAFLHAIWNTLLKSDGDKFHTLCLLSVVCGVAPLPFLFFVPYPDSSCIPYLLLSAFLHVLYGIFLVEAYRFGDLSFVYPITRGIVPLLVASAAYFFLGETLSFPKLLGISLTSFGVLLISLSIRANGKDVHKGRAFLFSLCTGLMIASYTVIDGMACRLAGNAFAYGIYLFASLGPVWLCIWFLTKPAKEIRAFMRLGFWNGTFAGIFSFTAYIMVICALEGNPIAMVSALRETSVLMGSIIGVFYLKEAVGAVRIFSALLVSCGIFLIASTQDFIFGSKVSLSASPKSAMATSKTVSKTPGGQSR